MLAKRKQDAGELRGWEDDVWMCGCVYVWMCGCVDVWMCGWEDVWMGEGLRAQTQRQPDYLDLVYTIGCYNPVHFTKDCERNTSANLII